MLKAINLEVKRWDWKGQTIWWVAVPIIISRLERGYYKTRNINIDLKWYDLSTYKISCEDLFDFMTHYKFVESADLSFPIIINNKGTVLDGRHRICKAILSWQKKIKAIQILDSEVREDV